MDQATHHDSSGALAGLDWRTAAARNLAAVWLALAAAQGQRTLREPAVWAADPAGPHPLQNSASLLRPLAAEDAPTLMARLRRFYAAGGGAAWALWSAWPAPEIGALGGLLAGRPPLMVRPPGPFPPAPPDLVIREAVDPATLIDFERTFIEGYPIGEVQPYRPGVLFTPAVLGGGATRLWVGYHDGQPVTCALGHVSDGVVGVYYVATLPVARGRGHGAAITARAAAAAPALPAVLQSSDLGRSVYQRLGFQIVAHFDLWIVASSGGHGGG